MVKLALPVAICWLQKIAGGVWGCGVQYAGMQCCTAFVQHGAWGRMRAHYYLAFMQGGPLLGGKCTLCRLVHMWVQSAFRTVFMVLA